MKASIKFRDEQKPLTRAKIPLNVLNVPFQSGVCVGESTELTLNLSTFFDSGPSLKFAYRPNQSKNPFSFIFKTGIGNFGSPIKSPLTMSAEFNLIGNQNPSFFIHFKPDFGDFSLKKSHSSEFSKGLGEKLNGNGLMNVENGYFKGNGFFPASPESKAAAGQVVDGLLRGTTLSAKTSLPLRDFAVVNFRWGLRVPAEEAGMDIDAIMVKKKGDVNGIGGIRLPLLVMNKIGIGHVSKAGTKEEKARLDVAEVCMEMRKKLDVIQAENGMLSKALSDLRSDIAAGKMDVFVDHRSKYGVDKKAFEGKGYGGKPVIVEGNKELSGA